MSKIAVSDTGPLLHLSEIEQESQLNIFDRLIISFQVKLELESHKAFNNLEIAIGDYLIIESVTQAELNTQEATLSRFKLHQADLSVAVLAERNRPGLVLTDDLELRKAMETQGHQVIGSLGIIIRGFKAGTLTKEDLQECITRLFDDSSLYLSSGLRFYVQKLLADLAK